MGDLIKIGSYLGSEVWVDEDEVFGLLEWTTEPGDAPHLTKVLVKGESSLLVHKKPASVAGIINGSRRSES